MERNYKVSTDSSSNTDSQRWNPEPVVPGLVIHPFEEDRRAIFRMEENSYYAYVQHGCVPSSPNYQKLMMRDGRWRGAMKAFISNHTKEQEQLISDREIEVDYLTVIRVSKSGKSLICKATYRPVKSKEA